MELSRRTLMHAAAVSSLVGMAAILTGCTTTVASSTASSKGSLTLSKKAWSYDSKNDVYYQIGKYYVASPMATDYESLGIYVPGKYMTATKNSDGTYTATVNGSGKVGSYTASTAPIVFPVNTPGYASQKPPTSYSYSDVSTYMKAGLVYVAPGLRGKDSNGSSYTGNAPWGVTDLKAAVRYIRYNADAIPGSTDRMFVFGMSGGGAQSAVMGASGDSALYTPYLTALGAAMKDSSGKTISDAIAGAMCWCPITSLDFANAAYEWNMGQFATTGTRASGTWTNSYSSDLSTSFVDYVNKLGLKDDSGNTLTLAKSSTGEYLSGSYYDHLMATINKSLNRFLSYTTFPYTPAASMGGGAPGGAGGSGGAPSGSKPSGNPPSGSAPSGGGQSSGGQSGAGSSSSSTTYKTVEAYIKYLNTDSTWVTYDASTNTAEVLNLGGFVMSQKVPTKDVGAFDGISRNENENVVFGIGTAGRHFAPISEQVIFANQSKYAKFSDWSSTYAAAQYEADFKKTDSVGKNEAYRTNMYNPMYYLNDYYAGYKTGTVAPHWRIRTGIQQPDTANTVELNLVAALGSLGSKVDFATVWGEGHTMAEETGDPVSNFIKWMEDSLA